MSAPANSSAAAGGLASGSTVANRRGPTKAQLQGKNAELEAENTELQGRIAELQQKLEQQEEEERERLHAQEYDRLHNAEEPDSPEVMEEKSREEVPPGRGDRRAESISEREPSPAISVDAKPPKPPTFEGLARSNVDIWLFEVESYFDAINFPAERRVSWASALLRDTAATWWRGVIKQTKQDTGRDPADNISVDRLFSWPQFKSRMTTRFLPVEVAKTARQKLLVLKQRKYDGIEGYNNEFQRLISMIDDMSTADQVNYYIMGLKPDVGRDVKISNPSSVQAAMLTAARSSDTFVNPTQPSLGSSFVNRFGSAGANRGSNSTLSSGGNVPSRLNSVRAPARTTGQGQTRERSRSRSRQEGSPVDQATEDSGLDSETEDGEANEQLNFIRRNDRGNYRPNPYLSREEWEKLKKEGKCFRCKRGFHVARDCPLNRNNSSGSGKTQGNDPNSRPVSNFNPLNSQARRA